MNHYSVDFARIFDEYGIPVFQCSSDLNVLWANRYISEENLPIAAGRHLGDIFPRNAALFLEISKRASLGLPFYSTNFELNLFNTALYILPIRENRQEPVLLCFLDLHKREDTDKIAGYSIAPIISDRYRSPVSSIINISAILAHKFQESEDYKSLEYLNYIAQCCYSMLRTSTSVQDYHMLINGKKNFNMKRLVLNQFLRELFDTLQVMFFKTGFKLSFETTDESIITRFDEDMLSLAIFHIISNCCNFSPLGSSIRISLSLHADKANIAITDEGSGIDSATLEKVFDPFFSTHAAPVPEENIGLGLGLPIVKQIINAHHGQIIISSEVNKGTAMVISLPLSEGQDPLQVHSDTSRYVTDKFSRVYTMFAEICDMKFF